MRFVVDQEVLFPALSTVSRIVPARVVRPICSSVLVTASNQHLRLTTTDMDTAAVVTVPVEVAEEGEVALPVRYLQEAIKRIPSGPITVSGVLGGAGARVHWQRAQVTVHGFPGEDFPPVHPFPENPEHSLQQDALRRAILHTVFAASAEESGRVMLTGVEIRLGAQPDAVFALSTDSFQVAAYAAVPASERPEADGMVVPAAGLTEAARILRDVDEPCGLARIGNRLLVQSGNAYLVLPLLEGKYFAVLDMVPKEFPAQALINREALLGACGRVALVSDSEAPYVITLRVGDGLVSLSAQSAEVGEANEEVSAETTGERLSVLFNSRQLLSGLQHLEGEVVHLELSGLTTLARFSTPEDQKMQYMQMPLQPGSAWR